MNSDPNTGASGPEATTAPQMGVQRIYIKDLSFESPLGPAGIAGATQARVEQDLGVGVRRIDASNFEVMLKLTVTLRDGERTIYLVELEQAGQFLASGMDDTALAQVLNIHCPTILFPYAREAVDNLLTRGGFPPLLLPPVNFEAVYLQALEQRGKAAAN